MAYSHSSINVAAGMFAIIILESGKSAVKKTEEGGVTPPAHTAIPIETERT